ncbi:MAG: DUF1707 domain-containing protein [Streptosporangiaceae bacterium]|nr:DUF1707 domain-containing protein [Streptosporangiaceae bacterium]
MAVRGCYAGIRTGLGGSRYVLRIGDAERDAAAAELREHFVAGRLTFEELDARLGEALSARTQDQLSRVMADLPSLGRPSVHSVRSAGSVRSTGSVGSVRSGGATPRGIGSFPEPLPDRGSRYAALALLLLAMLIWLFTAILFVRHGYPYQGYGPGYLGH